MDHAADKDLAFLELAHRCANDLGLAAGILNRARGSVIDDQASAALDDAAACIESIALVHQALEPKADDESATVQLGRYLPRLTNRLAQAYLTRHQVGCRLDVDPGRVGPDVARTLGLIVCELTRNAAKHAFAGRNGAVTVTLRAKSPPWRLSVTDNGHGMPGAVARMGGSRKGLVLVEALAASIGGHLALKTGAAGTVATVHFSPAVRT